MNTSVSNQYRTEFKVKAVKLAISIGNIRKAAKENGIHENTLRKWKVLYEEGKLIDDESEEFITPSRTSITDKHEEIPLNKNNKNTPNMLKNLMVEKSQENSSLSNKFEELYLETKIEVERLNHENSELRKQLNDSQISIGELFTEVRKLKRNNL